MTLNILRGIQGIGAAATIPASVSFPLRFVDKKTKPFSQLGILAQAFPPASHARSMAFASFAAGAPLGAAFGMAIGGALVQTTVYVFTVLPGRRCTFLRSDFTVLPGAHHSFLNPGSISSVLLAVSCP